MHEIWKDISGFEGLYQVSNLGRIKSFQAVHRKGKPSEYILKPYVSNNGYKQVFLYNGTKKKKLLVHRIVAMSFIDNPHNLPQVNHKDENRLNNCADNLEWCDNVYNNRYGTKNSRFVESQSYPIEQMTTSGKVIARYKSAKIAEALLGITHSQIATACRRGTVCHDFKWRYVDWN